MICIKEFVVVVCVMRIESILLLSVHCRPGDVRLIAQSTRVYTRTRLCTLVVIGVAASVTRYYKPSGMRQII